MDILPTDTDTPRSEQELGLNGLMLPSSNDTLSEETKKKIRKLMKADDEQLQRTESWWERLRKEDPRKHNAMTAQRHQDAIRLQEKFNDIEDD